MLDALAGFILLGSAPLCWLVCLAWLAVYAHHRSAQAEAYYMSDDVPVRQRQSRGGHFSFHTDPADQGCQEWARLTKTEDVP